MNTYSNDNICPHCGSKEVTYNQALDAFYCADCGEWAELEPSEVNGKKEIGIAMKNGNLTTGIVALLTKEATNYIKPFIYLTEPNKTRIEKLVKDLIACFEPADSNSEVYEKRNVCSRSLGYELDRRNFLNEYWVDIEHKIIKV